MPRENWSNCMTCSDKNTVDYEYMVSPTSRLYAIKLRWSRTTCFSPSHGTLLSLGHFSLLRGINRLSTRTMRGSSQRRATCRDIITHSKMVVPVSCWSYCYETSSGAEASTTIDQLYSQVWSCCSVCPSVTSVCPARFSEQDGTDCQHRKKRRSDSLA